MDWEALATVLAESHEHPLFVLDNGGVIRATNSQTEELLGAMRLELIGQRFTDICDGEQSVQLVADALRGSIERGQSELANRYGHRLTIELAFSRVGLGAELALLIEVTKSHKHLDSPTTMTSFDYSISTDGEFGRISGVRRANPLVTGSSGQFCFELLHDRSAPCTGCPAIDVTDASPVAYYVPPRADGSSDFTVMKATLSDASEIRVQVTLVPAPALRASVGARVAEMATGSALSTRERDVLAHLVVGESLQRIAAELGITPRTVKFHQSNVLKKLGGETRMDLIGRVFEALPDDSD